jgi:hypothetical protein
MKVFDTHYQDLTVECIKNEKRFRSIGRPPSPANAGEGGGWGERGWVILPGAYADPAT